MTLTPAGPSTRFGCCFLVVLSVCRLFQRIVGLRLRAVRELSGMRVFTYLFGSRKSPSGRALAFSRFDLALSVVLGIALLAAISYSAETGGYGWTRLRIGLVLGVFLLTTIAAQHRNIVFGCALGIVTMRLGIGCFGGSHQLFFLIAVAICGVGTWLLLRERGLE
jgi:hypothetical protein